MEHNCFRDIPPLPDGTEEGSEETLFEAPASDYGTEVQETEETQERGHKRQSHEDSDGPERGGSSGDRGERPPSPQATSSTDGLSEGTDDTGLLLALVGVFQTRGCLMCFPGRGWPINPLGILSCY